MLMKSRLIHNNGWIGSALDDTRHGRHGRRVYDMIDISSHIIHTLCSKRGIRIVSANLNLVARSSGLSDP